VALETLVGTLVVAAEVSSMIVVMAILIVTLAALCVDHISKGN